MICKALGKKEVALKKDGTPRKTPARDRMIVQKKALEAEIDQLKEQIDGCERRIDSTEAGEALFSARGWIKSTKESLIVRLEQLGVARFKDAKVQLCRKMNNEKIKLPNGKLLQFDVGSDPYSVQK